MMRRVRVTVTADDIAIGKASYSACPIALALRRAGVQVYGVGSDDFDVVGYHKRLPLTRAARRFIDRFDDGLAVEPSTFVLAVPA